MQTFQHRLIHFDTITADMDIPEKYRDLNLGTIQWLIRNLGLKNNKHPKYTEAMRILDGFARELKK